MRRVDLRHLGREFLGSLDEHMQKASSGEVLIFLFEVGDFTMVEEALKHSSQMGYELMNSLKFNQSDWTIVLKKASL